MFKMLHKCMGGPVHSFQPPPPRSYADSKSHNINFYFSVYYIFCSGRIIPAIQGKEEKRWCSRQICITYHENLGAHTHSDKLIIELLLLYITVRIEGSNPYLSETQGRTYKIILILKYIHKNMFECVLHIVI